jgi:hypothetical protein
MTIEAGQMAERVLDYLDTVLGRIQQESFGRRDAPQVTRSSDTVEDSDGAISGALEIRIRTRNGETPLIQREPFFKLKSRENVDDLLGEALSVLLMNHAEWPR